MDFHFSCDCFVTHEQREHIFTVTGNRQPVIAPSSIALAAP
jgi:hypothetical protein